MLVRAKRLFKAFLQVAFALTTDLILKLRIVLHDMPIVLLHLLEALISVREEEARELEHPDVRLICVPRRLDLIHHVDVRLDLLRHVRVRLAT